MNSDPGRQKLHVLAAVWIFRSVFTQIPVEPKKLERDQV